MKKIMCKNIIFYQLPSYIALKSLIYKNLIYLYVQSSFGLASLFSCSKKHYFINIHIIKQYLYFLSFDIYKNNKLLDKRGFSFDSRNYFQNLSLLNNIKSYISKVITINLKYSLFAFKLKGLGYKLKMSQFKTYNYLFSKFNKVHYKIFNFSNSFLFKRNKRTKFFYMYFLFKSKISMEAANFFSVLPTDIYKGKGVTFWRDKILFKVGKKSAW